MKKTQPQSQEINLNAISKVKMKDISTYIWSELEDVLVSIPIDFKTEEQKRSKSGTLILTYGAVYIFKNRLFSEYQPKYTLSLLDALKVEAYENSSLFIMTFTNHEFIIKTKYAVQVVETMAKVVAECTYGLLNLLILPRFTISHEQKEYEENGDIEDTDKNKKAKNQPSKTDKLINHSNDNSNKEDEPQGISLAEMSSSKNTSPKKVHFDDNDTEDHIPLGNVQITKFSSYFYNTDINGRMDIDNENTRRIRMSELVKSRPKNALIKRSLLLAHFYDVAGSNLDDAEYLKKYELNPTNNLTIGPRFKPGVFAAAYGHALGWEANLERITFLHFKPARFGDLLQALFINSANITQVTFVDYKYSTIPPKKKQDNDDDDNDKEEEKKKKDDDDDDPYHNKKRMMLHKSNQNIYIPDFVFSDVKRTNVKSIFFHDCDFQVISAFLTACENYTCPIEEFAITKCNILITEVAKVLRSFYSLECFLKIKRIGFLYDKIPQFPIEQLPPFLSLASCLENLVLSDLEVDGSQILVAVCNSNTPLKVLKLTNISFHTNLNLANLKLPAALMYVDFTKSSFSASAFKDIMALITSKRKTDLLPNVDNATISFASDAQKNPVLMVKMPSIILNKEGYESFKDFNYGAMQSNICEFDWSNNRIPAPVVPFFFKFLNTQKKMRILILNNIRLDKQALFFQKLQEYVFNIKLPGLDMTAGLYKKFLFTFYDSLKNQPFIRRCCVVGRGGGDEYVLKYTELIKSLPNVTEIVADGFLPRNLEFLLLMWRAIYDSKCIKANDFPRYDIKFLRERCSVDIDEKKFLKMLGNFKPGRSKPSYIMQRADFIIKGINSKNEIIKDSCPDFESDFFIASCSMPWIDSTPQAHVNEIQNAAKSILTPNDRSSDSQINNENDNSNQFQLDAPSPNNSSEKNDQNYYNPEDQEFLEDKKSLQEELIESDHEDDAEDINDENNV